MKDLNPGFDGMVEPVIQNGVVTSLKFQTEHVSDISPVRLFTKLTSIDCCGVFSDYSKQGRLKDLSPLHGMPMEVLQCVGSRVSDLSALKGMYLKHLLCDGTSVSDLSPLTGMPLKTLRMRFHSGLRPVAVGGIAILEDLNCVNTQSHRPVTVEKDATEVSP